MSRPDVETLREELLAGLHGTRDVDIMEVVAKIIDEILVKVHDAFTEHDGMDTNSAINIAVNAGSEYFYRNFF